MAKSQNSLDFTFNYKVSISWETFRPQKAVLAPIFGIPSNSFIIHLLVAGFTVAQADK